jgi:ABC-type sugar transport system permease subunit
MIAMPVGSMLLRWLFSQEGGIAPLGLGPLGLGQVSILADPQLAMGALVFNAMWRDGAFAMIMPLAGLKAIPPERISPPAWTAPAPGCASGASPSR